MLASSPRRLTTIFFSAIGILFYLFFTPSQRQSALNSNQKFSGWDKGSSYNEDASATDAAARLIPAESPAASEIPSPSAVPLPPLSFQSSQAVAPMTSSASISDHAELGKSARIHQATIIFRNDSDQNVHEQVLKLHVAHGDRWNYTTHVLRHDLIQSVEEDDRSGEWNGNAGVFKKPLYLLSLVINELAKPSDERAEWIVWFDGDTIILNPNIRWEHFLPPADPLFSNIHFIGSQDQDDSNCGFDCGVFFVRVHEWTVHTLTDVAALPRLSKGIIPDAQPDQDGMKHILRWNGRPDNVLFEPRSWFNAFDRNPQRESELRDGEFLVQIAGYHDNKTEAMKEYFDRVEKEPEKLAIPFEKTKLIAEIEDFWSNLWAAKTTLNVMDLELRLHNTTSLYGSSQNLREAIRWHPWDTKKLRGIMQEAETVMANISIKTSQPLSDQSSLENQSTIIDDAQEVPKPSDDVQKSAGA